LSLWSEAVSVRQNHRAPLANWVARVSQGTVALITWRLCRWYSAMNSWDTIRNRLVDLESLLSIYLLRSSYYRWRFVMIDNLVDLTIFLFELRCAAVYPLVLILRLCLITKKLRNLHSDVHVIEQSFHISDSITSVTSIRLWIDIGFVNRSLFKQLTWEATRHVCITRLPCSVTSGQRPHYNCKLISRDLGRRDWACHVHAEAILSMFARCVRGLRRACYAPRPN